jgi:hypothetical protein
VVDWCLASGWLHWGFRWAGSADQTLSWLSPPATSAPERVEYAATELANRRKAWDGGRIFWLEEIVKAVVARMPEQVAFLLLSTPLRIEPFSVIAAVGARTPTHDELAQNCAFTLTKNTAGSEIRVA